VGKGEGASATKAAAQTADDIPISNKGAGSKAVEDRGREVNSEAVSTIQSFFAAAVMSLRTALRESADTAGVKPVRLPFDTTCTAADLPPFSFSPDIHPPLHFFSVCHFLLLLF
jgi:hypothetical protein